MRNALLRGLVVLSAGLVLKGSDHDCPAYPASRWSFNPDTLENQAQGQDLMTMRLALSVPDASFAVSLARQNLSDEEFMRRVSIDLTGRPPDVDQLLAFLADQSSNKRERLVDTLLGSDAFVERWTYWLDELLKNTTASPMVSTSGRNALHWYLHEAVKNNVPYNQLASELIRA